MKYQKKPVIIDAFQWTGDKNQIEDPIWIVDAIKRNEVLINPIGINPETTMSIKTLEGTMEAKLGDFIIKGVKGEIYPCKPDIFALTYDKAPETFIDRLNIEGDELMDKISKLQSALVNKKVPVAEEDILGLQLSAMTTYLNILTMRMKKLQSNNTPV